LGAKEQDLDDEVLFSGIKDLDDEVSVFSGKKIK
jgi:hypothetical protein